MLGLIDDVQRTVGAGFRDEGDVVLLLGHQRAEIGASEFVKLMTGTICGDAPVLDIEEEKALQTALLTAIRRGYVKSAHDCAEGGLAVSLAECCLQSPHSHGAIIELPATADRFVIFGESQSRVVITADSGNLSELQTLMAMHKVPCTIIGAVFGDTFHMQDIHLSVERLRKAYEGTLPSILATPVAD